MSDFAAGHAQDHHEELEVWPDADITETSKPIPLWLYPVYAFFAVLLFTTYYYQFYDHAEEFPVYGPNYRLLGAEKQYPGKVHPRVTLAQEVNFTVGEKVEFLLTAEGGRAAHEWSADPDGMATLRAYGLAGPVVAERGYAISGTPTMATMVEGEAEPIEITLYCTSGEGFAEHTLKINILPAEGE